MCRDLGPAQHQGGRLQPPLLLLSHGGLQLLPAGPSSRPSPHHQHMLKTWGNQHSFSLKNRSGALLLRSYGPIIPVFLKHVFFFFLRCPKAGVSEILFKDFKILRMHLLFFFFWLRPWAGRSSQARDQTRVTAVTTPNLLLLLATRDLRDAHFIFIQCPTEPGPQDMAIKGKTGFSV